MSAEGPAREHFFGVSLLSAFMYLQVYAQRLGLWGPGSAFADFSAFLESMKRRGVTFLEMLSMEMKAEGYYVARGLSYK